MTAYAKLNLYLEVLGRRPDNYHSIFTLFEKISLSDGIRLKWLKEGQIRIGSSGFYIPQGDKNLAYKTASLLKRNFKVSHGVEIKIDKRIPVAAGLGGGSSNAATVLSGLNRLWRLDLGLKQLEPFAQQIGSDVPFFLHNCSFAYATSRGDEIRNLRLPLKLWHVIVVPRVKVSSSSVYKRWDEASESGKLRRPLKGVGLEAQGAMGGLTNTPPLIRILKSALLEKDFLRLDKLLFNSLEEISVASCPTIKKAKSVLSNLGVQTILMSGSGPSVFGLVSSRKEAYVTARQLKSFGNWDVFVAKTV